MSDTPTVTPGRVTTIKDALGRTLHVRRMSVGDRLRFLKLIPAVAQQNQLWITNAMVIASVTQIDDMPVKQLKSETDIENAGDALGDEGVEAATEALAGLLPKSTEAEVLATAGE